MSRIYEELKKAERSRQSARKPAAPSGKGRERRMAERLPKRVMLFVYGYTRRRSTFLEPAETVDVSASGCLLDLTTNVYQGQKLLLLNCQTGREQECEVVGISFKEKTGTRVAVRFPQPAPDFWKDSA